MNCEHPDHHFLKKPFNLNLPPTPSKTTSFILPMVSCAIASTLLVSFFWGTSEIMAALGFAAASASLLSPIGLGIAAGIAFGIGIYIGYQRYCYHKHTSGIKQDINNLVHQNQQLLNEYHADKTLLRKLRTARTAEKTSEYHQTVEHFESFGRARPRRGESPRPRPHQFSHEYQQQGVRYK
jgi:hypothetical protein